jgi:uncharacterized membrane protein
MDTVVVCLFLTVAVVAITFPAGPLVRAAFALPLLLFLPGYGVLLLLFPRRRREDDDGSSGLRFVERLALSFGLSLTLAPLVALGFELLGVDLSTVSVVTGLVAITGLCLLAGEGRRRRLPTSERYTVPLDRWLGAVDLPRTNPRGVDHLLNLVLVLSMVFALSSLGYGLMAPAVDEQYTNFYVVTEDGAGELVAADYPVNLTEEGFDEIVVGVDNHEGRDVQYHVVVQLQRVGDADAGELRVLDREEVARTTLSVPENESGRTMTDVDTPAPAMDGEGPLRLVYLLYEGEVSGEPTIETAYRSLYLWVEADDTRGAAARDQSSRRGATPVTEAWGGP